MYRYEHLFFFFDIEPYLLKYVYEDEVYYHMIYMLWMKMNIERKGFQMKEVWRKRVILQHRLWKCELTNTSIKWG